MPKPDYSGTYRTCYRMVLAVIVGCTAIIAATAVGAWALNEAIKLLTGAALFTSGDFVACVLVLGIVATVTLYAPLSAIAFVYYKLYTQHQSNENEN